MRKQNEQIGSGLGAWSKGLKVDSPELAMRLDRTREEGWKALEDLDLPRYGRTVVPADVFLQDPASAVDEILSERLFVFLQPAEGLPVRKTKLTIEEATDFVRETVGKHPEAWEVHLAETADETYGGNIVVKKDGRAIFEMTTQGQGGVSAGTVTPEIRA